MANGKKPDELHKSDLAQILIEASSAAPSSTPGSEANMKEKIEHLQREGYQIVKRHPTEEWQRSHEAVLSVKRYEGNDYLKFAVVSDTHFSSRKQQLTFLNVFYDRVVKEGIETVLHAGDWTDGDGRVYRGQEFELFNHGADAQVGYLVRNYPKRKGVTTYGIAGNHDWSFWERGGYDVVASFARQREDIKYLGPMSAKIMLGKLKVRLIHLPKGNTYARSYRMQKVIEQITPGDKPELMYGGHLHSWTQLPMYRNVNAWQMGCFQSQTTFEARMGLYPELGGLIVEIWYGGQASDRPNGIVRMRQEIMPFYVPRENDY
jgi:predicted phosphodiesterase